MDGGHLQVAEAEQQLRNDEAVDAKEALQAMRDRIRNDAC